jgi:tripartite-type tricarboxylate transporter receptor subunit TctC
MKCFSILVAMSLSVCGMILGVTHVQGQPYPNQPIQFVIPMDPGSAGDIVLRPLADELGKILNTSVMVVNKPGASATLGTDFVVKSKKDAYTLLYANTSAVVYAKASSTETVPYDPVKDLEPLGLHCFFPLSVSVLADSPWKTFGELIDYAKKNPGKVRVSTPGLGSIDNFNLETVKSLTGADLVTIPFKGGAAAITALVGGHVEVAFIAASLSGPHAKAGNVRILLLTNKTKEYPGVPILKDLGYKEDLLTAWFAVFAPAGIPDEARKVLVSAIKKAVEIPELKAKIEQMGYVVDYKPPEELKKLLVSDYERARALASRLGLGK